MYNVARCTTLRGVRRAKGLPPLTAIMSISIRSIRLLPVSTASSDVGLCARKCRDESRHPGLGSYMCEGINATKRYEAANIDASSHPVFQRFSGSPQPDSCSMMQ